MARVAFIKDGMELNAENVSGSYHMGDPLPVAIVEAGQEAWKNRMGYDDDAHVQAGRVWDSVRIGAQTFSAKQFIELQKQGSAPAVQKPATLRRDNSPVTLKAPDSVPESWALAAEITPTFAQAKTAVEKVGPKHHEGGPVINERGEVDFQATRDRDFAEALKKIGAKPRPAKPDTL